MISTLAASAATNTASDAVPLGAATAVPTTSSVQTTTLAATATSVKFDTPAIPSPHRRRTSAPARRSVSRRPRSSTASTGSTNSVRTPQAAPATQLSSGPAAHSARSCCSACSTAPTPAASSDQPNIARRLAQACRRPPPTVAGRPLSCRSSADRYATPKNVPTRVPGRRPMNDVTTSRLIVASATWPASTNAPIHVPQPKTYAAAGSSSRRPLRTSKVQLRVASRHPRRKRLRSGSRTASGPRRKPRPLRARGERDRQKQQRDDPWRDVRRVLRAVQLVDPVPDDRHRLQARGDRHDRERYALATRLRPPTSCDAARERHSRTDQQRQLCSSDGQPWFASRRVVEDQATDHDPAEMERESGAGESPGMTSEVSHFLEAFPARRLATRRGAPRTARRIARTGAP